ncbi:DNA polymerase beta superfamily protein [Tsukamurella serpentis]
MYSLRKYLRLAVKGNPTVLLPLYAPPGDLIMVTDLGRSLREQRSALPGSRDRSGRRADPAHVHHRARARAGRQAR